MKRNHMLDILKGLCIILIILDHYTGWEDLRLQLLFPYWITMAVPVLMIVLGYQYALSYDRHAITRMSQAYSLRFVLDKFLRYSIPFWMAFLVEFVISSISMGPRAIIGAWIRGLFTGGWGAGSYYYPILVQFIFVFPILYFIVKKYDFAGVIFCGLLNALYEWIQYAFEMDYKCYRLLLFRYILLIAFGCYVYFNRSKAKKWMSFVAFVVGAAFIWLYNYRGYTPKVITHWTQTSFIAVLFIIPIIGFVLRSSKLMKLSCPPLEFVGKASYNIFLVQMVYFNYAAARLYPYCKSVLLCNIANLVITIAVGSVFYLVERRISTWCLSCTHKKNLDTQMERISNTLNHIFTR